MKNSFCKIGLFVFACALSYTAFAQRDLFNVDSLKRALAGEKEDTNMVKTLGYIADYYWQHQDHVNALHYAQQILPLAKKINDKVGIGDAYLNMSLAYSINNDRFNLSDNFNKALAAYKASGDTEQILGCYSWMTEIYTEQDNFADALEAVLGAQKINEQTGNKKIVADGLVSIAAVYYSFGKTNEGLQYSFLSLNLYKELHDTTGIAYGYLQVGGTYCQLGRNAEGIQMLQQALSLKKNAPGTIANIYASMGDGYENEGDSARKNNNTILASNKYDTAEKIRLIALAKWKEVAYIRSIALAYNQIAFLSIKLNKLEAAKKFLDSCGAICQANSIKGYFAGIYYGYSKIDSIQGNYKAAYRNLRLYEHYNDSSLNQENAKKAVQVQMQYDFDKKTAFTKTEQDKKDADTKRIKNQQYFAIGALGIVVLAVVIIALIQFRNNKQKQKANNLITKQKQQVETTLSELKSTQAQLIQSEKMASLGELTAGIAHEIQNPLNFVNNFSEVNKELVEELIIKNEELKIEDKEVNEILNDIKANEEKINHHGKRADAIVRGMLQHSKKTSGQKEPTDINALADEYLRLAFHGMRAKDKEFNAVLNTDFDETIGNINIIPQDISRVLLNLYNNAFYALREKQVSGAWYEPTVSVSTKKNVNSVTITVSDNGNGIPQSIVDKIFQPFFTTKPTGQGTGLGLSLSYDIVKAHGGEIKVESKEGEGTMFIIQLSIT